MCTSGIGVFLVYKYTLSGQYGTRAGFTSRVFAIAPNNLLKKYYKGGRKSLLRDHNLLPGVMEKQSAGNKSMPESPGI
jgi:hypothetical protein